MSTFKKSGKCCICRGQFVAFGHSPWPASELDHARCCSECNDEFVIPSRLKKFYMETNR
jgi:hypothetical protein